MRKRKNKAKKTAKPKLPEKAAAMQTQPKHPMQVLLRLLKALGVVVGGIGGIVTISTLLGSPVWPTYPEVHTQDVIDPSSSSVLPFAVRNKSALFDIDDANFICGIDLAYLEDAAGHKVIIRGMGIAKNKITIKHSSQINYPCDVSMLVQVSNDGSLSLRQSMNTQPSGFSPPLKIRKMCIWIGARYEVFGWTWKFRSPVYQWPATSTARQWIEGSIAQDVPAEEQLPGFEKETLTCSEEVFPLTLLINENKQVVPVNTSEQY